MEGMNLYDLMSKTADLMEQYHVSLEAGWVEDMHHRRRLAVYIYAGVYYVWFEFGPDGELQAIRGSRYQSASYKSFSSFEDAIAWLMDK